MVHHSFTIEMFELVSRTSRDSIFSLEYKSKCTFTFPCCFHYWLCSNNTCLWVYVTIRADARALRTYLVHLVSVHVPEAARGEMFITVPAWFGQRAHSPPVLGSAVVAWSSSISLPIPQFDIIVYISDFINTWIIILVVMEFVSELEHLDILRQSWNIYIVSYYTI